MQRTQWQSISTVKWPIPAIKNLLLILSGAMALQACAVLRESGEPHENAVIPDSPQGEASFEALNQGLSYVREHPAQTEDEQIQRFLWLDQWIKVLQDKNRLTPEVGQEYWTDLTSFLKEPAVSASGIAKIADRAQSKLGRNVAFYYSYQALLKDSSIEDSLKNLAFIEEDGISDLYKRAQELLELLKVQQASESRKVGVLLPLSGELKAFSQEVVQSIQLVSSMAMADGIEFVIEDTGTNNDQLNEAWRRLAQEERVAMVLGPLTSKETEFIFERAELMKVPVISLAPKESLETFGHYSFRSVLAIEEQVKAVANFIQNNLQAKHVGVLLPDSSYGWDVWDRASAAFEEKGLDLTEMQVYPSGATDFKEPLKKMTRLDVAKLRKDELCPKDPTQAFPGCVKKLNDLKPLLNFEVLFAPDFADTAGLLLPTLPYLQIYGVQVIGLSGYNSPKLLERGGAAAEGVIFVDGYLPSSTNFPNRFFQENYTRLASREPTRIAAEAFDIALLSIYLMKKDQGIVSRDLIVERLKSVSDFPGVTGSLYFEDQRIKKKPKLLQVRNAKFQELRASN